MEFRNAQLVTYKMLVVIVMGLLKNVIKVMEKKKTETVVNFVNL